ncbi:HTH-type transcriptional regulator ArgP [Burkholderia multivorans]|uniref:HTH-type transcriptional regulator ArgP n=1 Tax=Burkholderia multivorans TaxID=87883 RepID=UPI001C23FF81|nr:HTH-type transcriptional regulator ArgP [Burkholderia multivorans]MBU9477971.1 HTH-type transcriptional regulator ArgP [Burkholderia multivorans]
MLDLLQLETFAAVVEHRHFRRAAAALNISPGAVSQRIKLLEESVGALLLIREPMITPTKAGEDVLRYLMSVRLQEDELLRRIMPGTFSPTALALAVNADSLATWFEPVARELAQHHVALEIVVDDQDHTLGALARGDVKGCISTERKPLTGFLAEPVGRMRYQCVATPKFASEYFAGGLVLANALKAAAILFNRKDTLHDAFLESQFGVTVGRYVKHYFPSPTALLNAILDNLGYGLVPEMQAEPLVSSGKLVALTPGHDLMIDLYWHHWESEPEPLAKISGLVMDSARRSLIQTAPTAEGDIS